RPVPQAPFTLHLQQLSLRWPGALSGPSDLDLQLYSGQTLLVVGPSGGGKSTLLHWLAGEPMQRQGRALLNGHPLDHWALTGVIGWLPRDVDSFDLPLGGNLWLGSPAACDARLWELREDVALVDWVRRLPQQLQLRPGEQDSALSGGEARRIALV